MIPDNTPVIIGVGQHSERPQDAGYEALSHMDMAGRALQAAIDDCRAAQPVAPEIELIAALRQWENSYYGAPSPFGRSNNPPRSIARRVGADPERAVLEVTGGQAPQKLVGEIAEHIAHCEFELAAIVGAEAVSTVLTLLGQGHQPDWSEEIEGELDDRGYGSERIFEKEWLKHATLGVIGGYACVDNARRHRLGLSLDQYRQQMGELFAPFTKVAAANPHSAAPVVRSAEELATVTERNRIVAEPYTRMTVARDQVNQGAAILISSVRKARELGVPEDRWVHIHSVATANELKVLRRPDLSRSPASTASVERTLELSGLDLGGVRYLDLYSCFAAPLFNLTDHFGLSADDPRGLTLTGGLPFFGGPGNNYSSHAIAEAVARCRADRGAYALVGANGGILSKYATGIYSTEPADWNSAVRYHRMSIPQRPEPLDSAPKGDVTVETYTWSVDKDADKVRSSVIVRTADGKRALIRPDHRDAATRTLFESGKPFGVKLVVGQDGHGANIGRVSA
ncbi:acetyl-CoA acetyltransferase [Altererythrobacter sp. GH1-8]|uniref:acetyl-CoA acetyltransferase n=1 Tax=Altererythrobacter sp. GH1-8 TaxID=3349333 RepID=UPI00374CC09F